MDNLPKCNKSGRGFTPPASSQGTRIWRHNNRSRRPGERKKTTTPVDTVAASSAGAPSQVKMIYEVPAFSVVEATTSQDTEEEKNDIELVESLNDNTLSSEIFKCSSENSLAESPKVTTLVECPKSSTESNLSEKKISSILRENVRLKEMFRNKNNCSRKQLNAIIGLHNEIQEICKNYKQRFLDATEFIHQLKRDSTLKVNSTLNLFSEDEDKTNNRPTIHERKLIGQLRDLSRQLKDSEENYSRSQLKLKEVENKFTVEVENFNKILEKYEQELKTLKEQIASSNPSDLLDSVIEQGKSDECKHIIQALKEVKVSYNEDVDELKLENDKIMNYKNALIDDQLQSIKDERIFKNIQIEFLKVFSDYNSISNKVECLKHEHLKNENTKKGQTSHDNLAEIEKCLLEEKKIIDNARLKLSQERVNIEEEKQNIRQERELFDAERMLLIEEKEAIVRENKEIIDENLYLHREVSKLKKELSNRKASTPLDEELESVKKQLNDVKEKLKISVQTNTELSNEISKMMDKEEEIWAYKMQVEMQQAEFRDMHQVEQNYLHQIEDLSQEIRELRQENERLRRLENEPNNNNNNLN